MAGPKLGNHGGVTPSFPLAEETHHAHTVVGYYAAWVAGGEGRAIVPDVISFVRAGQTLADAKTVAQAHFRERILSALEPGCVWIRRAKPEMAYAGLVHTLSLRPPTSVMGSAGRVSR
jgi:hypothetical protein